MNLEKLIEKHFAPKKGNELLIEMIESILSGDANINYLFHHLGQMLDDMDIEDDTILFCKIILSRNDFYYWEFKDKKIGKKLLKKLIKRKII